MFGKKKNEKNLEGTDCVDWDYLFFWKECVNSQNLET